MFLFEKEVDVMESRTVFMLFLSVFLAFALVAFFFSSGPKVLDNQTPDVLDGSGGCIAKCNTDLLCVENCKTAALNKASYSGDTGACAGLPLEERQKCNERLQLNKALKDNDATQCEGLPSAESCKNLILYNQALTSHDTSYCGQITEARTREMCNAM